MKYLTFLVILVSSFKVIENTTKNHTELALYEYESCSVRKAHPALAYISTHEKWKCYGRASQNYRKKKCTVAGCSDYYIMQVFCAKLDDGSLSTIDFYHSDTFCKYSNSNYHDNRKINSVDPCQCDNLFFNDGIGN